jgi:hypothetical protein
MQMHYPKILAVTVAVTSFFAFMSITSAKADEMPGIYLGQWCLSSPEEGRESFYFPREPNEECEYSDGYLTLKRNGYEAHEQTCRYVSVKKTGKTLPASTKPTKADWIPVMDVVARCHGEGETWSEKLRLSYYKGSLSVETLKR